MKRMAVAFSVMFLGALTVAGATAATSTRDGWIDDYELALRRSAAEKKNILVDFSGSDWCEYCKELDENVFATDVFRQKAPDKYVLLFVDSPQDPALLSEKARRQNPQLVEKYAIRGFPTVLVLDATGKVIAEVECLEDGPEAFLKCAEDAVREAPDVEKYIKPIEMALNAWDAEMEKEVKALNDEFLAKVTNQVERLSADEKRRAVRELNRTRAEALYGSVMPKYILRCEQALVEARAMAVPAHMEERKKALIDGQEARCRMMKTTVESCRKKLASPIAAEDADDGPGSPVFAPPLPKDAHTEADFFEQVALPFYTKHIVETYDAASETNAEVRSRVLRVRESLAHHLAYNDIELYPEPDRAEDARWLWSRKCRDAAVALYVYDSGSADDMFWGWKGYLADVAAKHDLSREPILGMLLRRRCYHRAEEHHRQWPTYRPDGVVKAAYADFANSFESCTGILAAADCRIAEWMDLGEALPLGSGAKIGNRYLELCQRAAACKDSAFAARGEGWAKDVSEEGWKGWRTNNLEAEKCLLEAAALRPECARPAMMLADLYSRSCGSGDPMMWLNRGVSNSLDEAAMLIGGTLQFMTSRWGGSTELLVSIATNAADNVCVSSRFAYKTAAVAIGKVIKYDYEGMTRDGVYRKVLTGEVTASLCRMFDAYIAANADNPVLRPDFFRTSALTLAIEARDWDRARAYYDAIGKGITDLGHLHWIGYATAQSEWADMDNMMVTLGMRRCGRELIDAEQALAEGRFGDAYAYYGKMCERSSLSQHERWLAGSRAFIARKRMQEQAGGWVDLMPNRCGGDTWNLWNDLVLGGDGRARLRGGDRVNALSLVSIPGAGTEVEATIHFEQGEKDRKLWNIGWGWARPFRCMQSGWGYPYIGFSRDEKGDRFEIDVLTKKNCDLKDKDAQKRHGEDPLRAVCSGELATADSHTFRAVFGERDFTVEIDGKAVYALPMKDLLDVDYQRDRLQYPSGEVMPVWKVYRGSAFSGYRYRLIK